MSSKPTIIYLIRHGESEYNALELISGHSDPALTERGREQAHEAKQKLKHVKFDNAFSSDLQRAFQTGAIIYESEIPAENRLPNFRERDFGSLDARPQHLLEEGNKHKRKLSKQESWHFRHVPDMESDHEIAERFIGELESC